MGVEKDANLPPVVILAGGLGTRLRSMVADRPKILAPIDGKPFLYILIQWLKAQGVHRLIFSLGYKAEQVIKALSLYRELDGVRVEYVIEAEPKGTLGGLSLALNRLSVDECLVINGDTFVDLDLNHFLYQHRNRNSAALATVKVNDPSRYGCLTFKNEDVIESFEEKSALQRVHSWINAGIYYFSSEATNVIKTFDKGAIEQEFFSNRKLELAYSKYSDCSFLDIGTPESYGRAAKVLKEYL
ncbi:sugar phosphate nucleotidyltransferase [Shewanella sp. UCD-KL12]|uniref:sugar phosphate nucleotidyltransferase n=1 Tax=Shewanella sp. UCD-KL12 TaxID=1917163 RepID=UPI00097065F1|nr:sugar phosphate nucleotidyltransferase [Shewanella sp. UCD-KL12]